MATPPTALAVRVPDSVLPPGLLPSDRVTGRVAWVAWLSYRSYTVTWTAGAMELPATTSEGWPVKPTRKGAPGVMLNVPEVSAVNVPDEAVSL